MLNKTVMKQMLHVKNTVINSVKNKIGNNGEEQLIINVRPTKGHQFYVLFVKRKLRIMIHLELEDGDQ